MIKLAVFVLGAAFSLQSGISIAQSATSTDCPCAQLAKARIPHATITVAECVPAGTFTPPGNAQPLTDLPAFCRIAAILKPSTDSHIRIELWLPETGWNERFLGTGTGGGAGYINYGSLAMGLRKGFATANTDMGTSPGANEQTSHPEKWIDFGHRATHEMTVAGKAITEVFYHKPARMAYFSGCSTGGQQALMESQRYPDDYDGILAGAPANNRTHLHSGFVWILRATNDAPGSTLPRQKLDLVTRAVLRACAGKDGGASGDNFLTNPAACLFDPETLPICPDGADDSTCLTKSQLTALKKIWQGPINPRTSERIYTPIPLGSENVAAGIDMQQNPALAPNALFYQYKWAFGKDFDYKAFDFDRDQDRLDALLGPVLNANSTDLSAFKSKGSKLLMYTGTADPLVPYQDALSYYERVIGIQGGIPQAQDFFRFYLIPGMGHCSGGPGLNDGGDMLGALVEWKEKGIAPQQLIGTAYQGGDSKKGIRFQRPVYPYPLLPAYKAGNETLPESYEGRAQPLPEVMAPAARYLK